MRNRAREFVYEYIRHRPSPHAYYSFGQIWALEKGQDDFFDKSHAALEGRLATTKSVAGEIGSRLVLMLVPASIQVCSPRHLMYLSKEFSLDDSNRFDLDQPQQRMAESAAKIGIEHVDLRMVFDQDPDPCPYHPDNLHWTVVGHRQVAEFIADWVMVSIGSETSN